MKKQFIFLCLIIVSILFFLISCIFKNNTYNFKYYNLNYQLTDKEQLPKTKIIFIYFSTECESCLKTIQKANEISKTNKELNFIFIADETNEINIKNYLKNNKININYNSVFIDKKNTFNSDFNCGFGIVVTYPKILFYDENSFLVKELPNLDSLIY